MPHSRAVPSIGARCHEQRIVDDRRRWRIIYDVAEEAIVILHVFEKKGLKQADVARAIGSSQSRVAKMEAADPSVSMDLLVRTLLCLGASPDVVSGLVSGESRQKAPV